MDRRHDHGEFGALHAGKLGVIAPRVAREELLPHTLAVLFFLRKFVVAARGCVGIDSARPARALMLAVGGGRRPAK